MKEKKQDKKYFVGEQYDKQYKYILSIVVPCVVFGTGVAWLVQMFQEPDIYWYMEIGRWIGRIVSNGVMGYVMTTVIFVILERLDVSVNITWLQESVDQEVHKERRIRRGKVLGDMFWSIFFIAVFAFIPEIFCGIFKGGEEVIPVFNIPFIEATRHMILIMWGLGFINEVCKFIYLSYNKVVVVVTCITNIMTGCLTVWWLKSGELINGQFIDKVLTVIPNEEPVLTYVLTHMQQIVLVIICFGLVVEVVEVMIKAIAPSKVS